MKVSTHTTELARNSKPFLKQLKHGVHERGGLPVHVAESIVSQREF